MSRVSRLTCATAVVAFAAFSFPAAARTVFAVQIDNWYVGSLTNSCIAFNRLPKEYNYAPWNSLTIHTPKDGGFLLEVAFWPKSFEVGSRHNLTLRVEGRGFHEIDADAVGDHALKSRGPIPGGLVKDLDTARLLTIKAANVPSSLAFDMTRIGDIFTYLDNCRRLIAQN